MFELLVFVYLCVWEDEKRGQRYRNRIEAEKRRERGKRARPLVFPVDSIPSVSVAQQNTGQAPPQSLLTGHTALELALLTRILGLRSTCALWAWMEKCPPTFQSDQIFCIENITSNFYPNVDRYGNLMPNFWLNLRALTYCSLLQVWVFSPELVILQQQDTSSLMFVTIHLMTH